MHTNVMGKAVEHGIRNMMKRVAYEQARAAKRLDYNGRTPRSLGLSRLKPGDISADTWNVIVPDLGHRQPKFCELPDHLTSNPTIRAIYFPVP